MAATVQSSLRSSHTPYMHHSSPAALLPPPHQHREHNHQQRRISSSKQRFFLELSQCLVDFVIQLLPTVEELAVKEDVRKLLERLIRTIEPDSRLLAFGSTANGFSLRNSDMDLCCLITSDDRLSASDLVNMLGDLLERETKFHVKPLPHARIPIVKLNLDPSPGLPFGISCDIGFENKLALENTRLLMCYAMIDPARVRTMVLFLKVWSKRRKINSPYQGTLSSYGYVLLVIYFLVHVKNPPVLPNLQQMVPLRPISKEDMHLDGYNVWFFDDMELLRQRWQSSNTESVAELLIDFFKYFSRDFSYNIGVASIRAGFLKKDSKGWLSEADINTVRERNRFCIEDPFETDFNVARCVTKDGLFMIRGEFMRASRVLATRPDRAIVALAQLCEERRDEEPVRPTPSTSLFVPPRLSPVPPRPSTVVCSSEGNFTNRSTSQASHPMKQHSSAGQARSSTLTDNASSKRGKRTSTPRLGVSATVPVLEDKSARGSPLNGSSPEKQQIKSPSSKNSDVLTGDEPSSDFAGVESFATRSSTGESASASSSSGSPVSSSSRLGSNPDVISSDSVETLSSSAPNQTWTTVPLDQYAIPLVDLAAPQPALVAPSRIDSVRRPMTSVKTSLSSIPSGYGSSHTQLSTVHYHLQNSHSPTVFYETSGRIPTIRLAATYPINGACTSTLSSPYDHPPLYHVVPASIASTASLPQHVLTARKRNSRKSDVTCTPIQDGTGYNTPTTSTPPYNSQPSSQTSSPSYSHSPTVANFKAFTTAPTSYFSTSARNNHRSSSISSDNSSPRLRSKRFSNTSQTQTQTPRRNIAHEDSSILSIDDYTPDLTFSSSPPASTSAGSSGGSPDSLGRSSNYATTSSNSPPSPTQLNRVRTPREGRLSASFLPPLKDAGVDLATSSATISGHDEAKSTRHHQ